MASLLFGLLITVVTFFALLWRELKKNDPTPTKPLKPRHLCIGETKAHAGWVYHYDDGDTETVSKPRATL